MFADSVVPRLDPKKRAGGMEGRAGGTMFYNIDYKVHK